MYCVVSEIEFADHIDGAAGDVAVDVLREARPEEIEFTEVVAEVRAHSKRVGAAVIVAKRV